MQIEMISNWSRCAFMAITAKYGSGSLIENRPSDPARMGWGEPSGSISPRWPQKSLTFSFLVKSYGLPAWSLLEPLALQKQPTDAPATGIPVLSTTRPRTSFGSSARTPLMMNSRASTKAQIGNLVCLLLMGRPHTVSWHDHRWLRESPDARSRLIGACTI